MSQRVQRNPPDSAGIASRSQRFCETVMHCRRVLDVRREFVEAVDKIRKPWPFGAVPDLNRPGFADAASIGRLRTLDDEIVAFK